MVLARSRYTASMRSVWPAVETFRREGRDVRQLLLAFDLSEADVDNSEQRIPQNVVSDLWDRAALLSGDPSFGMRALQTLSARRRGLVEFLLLNSPTLGSMIERGLRYERLWQEGRGAAMETRGDVTVLRWTTAAGLRFSAPLSEFALALVVLMARAATHQPLYGEARFPHAAPAELHRYEAVFSGPLHFNAGELSLSFPTSLLATPLPRADGALLEILECHARDALARLPTTHSTAQAVRQALTLAFREDGASPDSIAGKLHMSGRTLRRRLADEGVTYQSIVEELRRELATEYLANPRISVTEIGFLLGFADTATFSKAFRRWTGKSPSAARAALTDGRNGQR